MRFMAAILAIAFSVTFTALPTYATDADKTKQQQGTEKKKKDDQKQKRSDTGPQGEEQTGGAGPSGPSSGGNVKAPQHEGAGSKSTR
ncbi:MAG TPA: hypothetical protein VJ805_11085 [Nitrospiraceae bacterium]|nr:hypothetical protein [Nitrospiraceae bacterium]